MRWPWTRRLLSRQELGALGERHAARALRAKGLRILEGNFRVPQGELDIIARDGDTLVLVEVRTRTSEETKSPLASVDHTKQQKIIRLGRLYRRARRLPECHTRYDVVEVIASHYGEVKEVRHVEGAFIDGM